MLVLETGGGRVGQEEMPGNLGCLPNELFHPGPVTYLLGAPRSASVNQSVEYYL